MVYPSFCLWLSRQLVLFSTFHISFHFLARTEWKSQSRKTNCVPAITLWLQGLSQGFPSRTHHNIWIMIVRSKRNVDNDKNLRLLFWNVSYYPVLSAKCCSFLLLICGFACLYSPKMRFNLHHRINFDFGPSWPPPRNPSLWSESTETLTLLTLTTNPRSWHGAKILKIDPQMNR